MATQTLPPDHRQMLDAVDPRHEPVLRSLAVDQAGAYAEEVRVLRRKVAALEAALAEAHAAPMREQSGECRHAHVAVEMMAPPSAYVVVPSEFVAPSTPAVVPIGSASHRSQQQPVEPAGSRVVATVDADSSAPCTAEAAIAASDASMASFAAAWGDEQASFEERFAAKAFFQVGTVDEASRQWLLSADQS